MTTQNRATLPNQKIADCISFERQGQTLGLNHVQLHTKHATYFKMRLLIGNKKEYWKEKRNA